MVKIVLIGAGSSSFSVELLKDISAMPGLEGCSLALVDIDENKLRLARKLAEKFCREIGRAVSILATTDRREALVNADYVITAVKIGGWESLEEERRISEEFGFYRGMGDRVCDYYGGIGAYHQIRFLLDLAADMRELCPDAWLVNTSNPVFEATNYVLRHTKIKAVGICHGHFEFNKIPRLLGLDPSRVSAVVCGLNHVTYLKSFLYDGKDAYPLLDEWIEKHAEKYWASDEYNQIDFFRAPDYLSPGAIDAYKLYGLMPIGDGIRAASPWWHHTDLAAKIKWYGKDGGFDSEINWANYLAAKKVQNEKIKKTAETDTSVIAEFGRRPTVEQHIQLIDSLANDNERILTINVLNNGAIEGLPDNTLAEIQVRCSGHGLNALHMGAFPPKILNNVLLPRVQRAENIMDAFARGDRSVLYLMAAEDHRARSFEGAKTLVDKLLALPWNEEANKHYT